MNASRNVAMGLGLLVTLRASSTVAEEMTATAAAGSAKHTLAPAVLNDDRLRASAITIAGGVSLGSYGAGFLYYYTLARQQANEGASLKVVTGASAGSINAVLTALSLCRKPQLDPESNLFFDTWIPVGMHGRDGFPGLHDLTKVTKRSLFSRAPIDTTAGNLKEVFERSDLSEWSDDPCNVLLGIVSTQLVPRRLPLQRVKPTPVVSRQTQKFLIRLSRERQAHPTLRTDVGSHGAGLFDLYPILGRTSQGLLQDRRAVPDHGVNFDELAGLMKASAAFPLAFEPMRVQVTQYNQRENRWENACDPSEPQWCRNPEFIDGGVFENVPLHLARRLEQEQGTNLVVDTETTPWHRPETNERSKGDLLSFAKDLAGSVLSSTMGAELFSTFEQDPSLRDANSSIAFTTRNLPTASGHLGNFLGFFDRDFRVFDFYLGMLDARAFVGADRHIDVSDSEPKWALMRCFEAWSDAAKDFSRFPKTSELNDACTPLRVGDWDDEHLIWQGARFDQMRDEDHRTWFNAVRLLAAAHHYRDRETRQPLENESVETDAWFDLMKDQGVSLSEIDADEFDDSRELIRDELLGLLYKFAGEQGGLASGAFKLGVRTVGNYLAYREPFMALTLGLHADRGLEAGTSLSLPRARFELNLRAQAIRLRSGGERGATLRAGPRVVWALGRKRAGALLQWEPFLGFGASGRIRADGNTLALSPEAGVYLSVLQTLYFSLSGGTLHRVGNAEEYERKHPGVDRLSWQAFGSVGWRFLWGAAADAD